MDLSWWWLSFADGSRPTGSQFLGAVIVRGLDVADAASAAWVRGINPGGGVLGVPVPMDPPAEFTNRLLTLADCEAFDRAVGGEGGAVAMDGPG